MLVKGYGLWSSRHHQWQLLLHDVTKDGSKGPGADKKLVLLPMLKIGILFFC